MGYEFSMSKVPDHIDDIKINEIAHVWPEEVRNQRYKDVIGEFPRVGLAEEEIARRILDPEYGRGEVLRENREADTEGENLDYYPKKRS